MEIRGLIPATLTPFTKDNQVDLAALASHVQRVASASGLFGIAVNGHAGEVLALSSEERESVVRAARAALPRQLKLIAGIESHSIDGLVREGVRAKQAGADMLLVIPPFDIRIFRHLAHDAAASFSVFERLEREDAVLPRRGRIAHDLVDELVGVVRRLLERDLDALQRVLEDAKRELDHGGADGAAHDDHGGGRLRYLGDLAAFDGVAEQDSPDRGAEHERGREAGKPVASERGVVGGAEEIPGDGERGQWHQAQFEAVEQQSAERGGDEHESRDAQFLGFQDGRHIK